ncbi:MAG: NAD(P)-dependent oxidoreductase [Halanaeroarchaeum sp.]
MAPDNTVGVVGLGQMGGRMARHLIDGGWTVVGYDLDETALATAEEYGVDPAASAAALAGRVDVVVTSLPDPDAVESAYLGEAGIAAGAHDDLVALEASTSSPETTVTIDESTDVDLLDAPVSGGTEGARDGSLTVMVGGDEGTFEREDVQAVLHALGADVYHLGDLGAGHTTKLLNNQIGSAVRAATLEAAAVAAVEGVDWKPFLEVVRHSSGSSYMFRKRMPRVLNREFEPGFSMANTRKDARLAMEMADAVDAPTPITNVVHHLYKRADAEGLSDEDNAAVVKLFERTTGVPVESEEYIDHDFLDWREI